MKQIEHEEIKLELEGMLFTWDDEKEKINFRKHGIHFSAAAAIFTDIDAVIENNSTDEFTGEERMNIIGMLSRVTMFVVYVERVTLDDNDIIRIISARRAERDEKRRYVYGT